MGTVLKFDLNAGREARDAGIDIALQNERKAWRDMALHIIDVMFPVGWVGLAEEFQEPVIGMIGGPHVPQVWGGLTSSLIKRGYFRHTGGHAQCEMESNHAREGKYLLKLNRKRDNDST
jgi:hypothetical protein